MPGQIVIRKKTQVTQEAGLAYDTVDSISFQFFSSVLYIIPLNFFRVICYTPVNTVFFQVVQQDISSLFHPRSIAEKIQRSTQLPKAPSSIFLDIHSISQIPEYFLLCCLRWSNKIEHNALGSHLDRCITHTGSKFA